MIAVEGAALGSVWAVGPSNADAIDQGSTRALSLAADQLGLALRRDQLAATATSAELARRSDALKSALLDSVSHDLRTPLARIRALAGGLLDEEVAVSLEAARTSVGQIDQEAAHLNEIVANLLDLSRIEGGALRPELEAHDLADLVQSCLIRHGAFDASRISVDVPESIGPVLVDALFLDQALTNVLENATRHGGKDVHIRVSARPVREAAAVELSVEDDGPGVADADLPQLFEKFYRGRGPARGGAGIGLTVARGLISAMGGEMTRPSRSSLGGLAVRIRLPLADARAVRAEESETAARSSQTPRLRKRTWRPREGAARARLLLVEDDATAREALATNLAGHGYGVQEVGLRARGPARLGRPSARPDPARPRPARSRRLRPSSAASDARRPRPSWCCRPGARSATACPRWRRARTTT